MTWGTGPWGSGRWGTGTSTTPPSTVEGIFVEEIVFVTPYMLRLRLSHHVVVDDLYSDPENYTIQLHKGVGVALEVVRVLDIHGEISKTDTIYLKTQPHTEGLDYAVRISELRRSDGVAVTTFDAAPYAARTTKTMAALKSIPAHFDRRADAVILNLLAAISMEDDNIGGSRNDEFDT